MLNIRHLLLLTLVALLIGGCAEMAETFKKMEVDRYQSTVKQARDPYMLELFYNAPEFAKMNKNYGTWFISLKQANFAKGDSFEGGPKKLRSDYLSYDSSADAVAQFYIKAVKDRGNSVKMYKPAINKMILGMTNINMVKDRYSEYTDWDNAFIEFDKNNRMVSALARMQRISPQAVSAFFQDMYSVVIFNEGIRNFENKADNALLAKYIVSEM